MIKLLFFQCVVGMDELTRISNCLYDALCGVIGSDVIVHIRRTATNLRDDVNRMVVEEYDLFSVKYFSGSKAEGLRFRTSDYDYMFVSRRIRVIPSDAFISLYDTNTTLFMMENEMTKPGFALLRLIKQSPEPQSDPYTLFAHLSTVSILNCFYISSKLWRETHTEYSLTKNVFREFTHGPCTSAQLGSFEYDNAYCLQCDIWPVDAHDCIKRLHQCGWPSRDTILSIINDGVLFVAIGAKQSYFENTEWRMSFSLAEKKLIHAMNHTQFLCYSLLKIFLKEAIDSNGQVKGLLCSYFLKTAVFWEITSSPGHWNRSSLLMRFWKCFHRLIQWVSCSYCPNFFIPKNNMFGGKIEGGNRNQLLKHLTILYNEGFNSLLRCQSLAQYLSIVIESPQTRLVFNQGSSEIAVYIIRECMAAEPIYDRVNGLGHTDTCAIYRLAVSSNNALEKFILRTWFYRALAKVCLLNPKNATSLSLHNTTRYKNFAQTIRLLKRCQTDSVSHYLYQGMVLHDFGKHVVCLEIVKLAKDAVLSPCSINGSAMCAETYRLAGGDNLPMETVMKNCFLPIIDLFTDRYLSELYIELHCADKPRLLTVAVIPPFVFAVFLQYLCYHKLGRQRERDEALRDLSLYVQHDNGRHIKEVDRFISWEILGICQQMKEDDAGACHSYLKALQLELSYRWRATCIRLGTIFAKYF